MYFLVNIPTVCYDLVIRQLMRWNKFVYYQSRCFLFPLVNLITILILLKELIYYKLGLCYLRYEDEKINHILSCNMARIPQKHLSITFKYACELNIKLKVHYNLLN